MIINTRDCSVSVMMRRSFTSPQQTDGTMETRMFVLLFEQSFICSPWYEEQDQQQDTNLSDNHVVTPGSFLWCPGVSHTRETRGQIRLPCPSSAGSLSNLVSRETWRKHQDRWPGLKLDLRGSDNVCPMCHHSSTMLSATFRCFYFI